MKKFIVLIVFLIVSLFLVLIFNIDFRDGSNGVRFDLNEFDFLNSYDKSCFDDGIFYYSSSNISIISSDVKKILFFYEIDYQYKNGNLCDNEYILSDDTLEEIMSLVDEVSEVLGDKTRISVDDILFYELDDDTIYFEYYLDSYVVYLYNIDNYTVLKVVYPSDYKEFAIFQ